MEQRIRVGIIGADAKGQGWAPLSHLPALKILYLRMARAIREGQRVKPDFDVAVHRHRLIDAIQQSSDEGRVVALA